MAPCPRALKLSVNAVLAGIILDNKGPRLRARMSERCERFYAALEADEPEDAFKALTAGIDLERFVGDAALGLTPLLWSCGESSTDDGKCGAFTLKLLALGANVHALDADGEGVFSKLFCGYPADMIPRVPALFSRGAREPRALL